MPNLLEKLTPKKEKDIRVLAGFTHIFCRENHAGEAKNPFSVKDERLAETLHGKPMMLCKDCARLLNHGIAKLLQCTQDPKPMCKRCTTQCYAPGYRERIRQVMKFSGLYLVKHGRVDMILHYFF